jgi:hypothetical protein
MKHRVRPVRGDFDQGRKDETSLVESGMRNEKAWFLDDAVVIEQDVQVKCARALTVIEISTQRPFNFLKHFEQTLRRDIGFQSGNPVEKPFRAGRGSIVDRLGLIKRGDRIEP